MKKKLSIALVLSLCVSLCSAFTAFADEPVAPETPTVTSGTLGTSSVTWNFDTTTGILTLAGSGATPNYTINAADPDSVVRPPWYDWASLIKAIVVKEGVTPGSQLFLGSVYTNCKKVQIYGSSSSELKLEPYSFADLRNVETFYNVYAVAAKNNACRNMGAAAEDFDFYCLSHLGAWYGDAVSGIPANTDIYYGDNAAVWDPEGSLNCAKNFTTPVLHNCVNDYVIGDLKVTISGKATLEYICNKATNAVLILGAYDEDGKLIKAVSKPLTFAKGDTELVNPVEIENDAEGVYTYKAYLWDGFTNLTPLVKSASYSMADMGI